MTDRPECPHTHVAIVGTGFSGLGMAIALKQAGFEFTVFERRHEVGGTWLENTYPGCQCDVPSNLYSFSFAPNPDWTQTYSFQPEISAYLKRVTDQFDLRPQIKFDHQIHESAWDEANHCWRLETSHGTYTADVLILGSGSVEHPVDSSVARPGEFRGQVVSFGPVESRL